MLIRTPVLQRIKKGEITLAFRKWRRPTVKKGGTITTAIGVLAITNIEKVAATRISHDDAHAAGYPSREALLEDLGVREGRIYRVELTYAGADPRIALREDVALDESEITEIRARLHRLDMASRVGPWTHTVLTAIGRSPDLVARDLASQIGREKEWLKRNVRKLKSLGLTVSHHPGYTLSPRGRMILDDLNRVV